MTPQLDVTCIIPTHDRNRTLLRALKSIREQTIQPKRVVVSDDMGQKSTQSIAEQASAQYVSCTNHPDPGAAASRNAGAAGATTKYLAFLDDDDYWTKDYLQRALDILETTGVDLVVSWGHLACGPVVVEDNWAMRSGIKNSSEILTSNPGITGSNFVIRREFFEKVGGFDPRMLVFNDLDFFIRFLDSGGSYRVSPKPCVVQTITGKDHLSSRGFRRAHGVRRFHDKYATRINHHQRRTLLREENLAQLTPGLPLLPRLGFLTRVIVFSSPSDHASAIRRRISRSPTYN